METFYDVLQVKEDASPEIIRAAYKALSSKFHPDRNRGADAASTMQRINDAYRILRDPKLRARYDDSLKRSRAQAAPSEPPAPPKTNIPSAPPKNKSPSIWWPIIVAAIGVKAVGAVGAIVGFALYYWLEPKKGWVTSAIVSSLASLVIGVVVAAYFGDALNYGASTAQQRSDDDVDWAAGQLTPLHAPDIAAVDWHRENTGSADAGPWLQYGPGGMRFCRAADNTIIKLLPPGSQSNAPQSGMPCATPSVASAAQL